MMQSVFKVVLVIGVFLVPLGAQPLGGGTSWVQKQGVLFGNSNTCSCIGVLDFKKVMRAIPEIVQIRNERPGPAKKTLLIKKADERLKRALRAAAKAGPFDCIVKKKSITGTPPSTPVDITREMIRRVKK